MLRITVHPYLWLEAERPLPSTSSRIWSATGGGLKISVDPFGQRTSMESR